ncbi:MAG: hypothetical protein COZ09_10160 [Comamonadaceae bacterium CG_4_10_14_3_um_filter_60_42]|nr:MAG: hypothetical protein COZ09_10160 [Comamonadaceae bacterium CG_4_10_14_3_um_filter_60_42]
MGVFRDVSLTVGGKEYIVSPSNRLLRRIEMKARQENPRFNLVEVMFFLQTSAGSMPDMAFILAEFVNSAGGKMSEDEALSHIVRMEVSELQALKESLCGCIMPEVDEKKPEAPE